MILTCWLNATMIVYFAHPPAIWGWLAGWLLSAQFSFAKPVWGWMMIHTTGHSWLWLGLSLSVGGASGPFYMFFAGLSRLSNSMVTLGGYEQTLPNYKAKENG